jgi:hypothetical protein
MFLTGILWKVCSSCFNLSLDFDLNNAERRIVIGLERLFLIGVEEATGLTIIFFLIGIVKVTW